MTRIAIFTFTLILLSQCAIKQDPSGDKDMIHDVMSGQAKSWNKGDVEGYMKGYWMSDSLVFTGTKTVSVGWQAATDRYKIAYPDKTAMGHLTFEDVNTNFTSKSSAYSTGRWNLFREADTLTGRFTLIWKKQNSAWFIIADHSS